jgi:hypothetical protein
MKTRHPLTLAAVLLFAATAVCQAVERTGAGTIQANFSETNVEIEFSFDFESLSDEFKRQIVAGDGTRTIQRFQNFKGMFNFPNRGRCHIEDISVKGDPVFRRKQGEGEPPIDYSGGHIRVEYTYCCDAASRRNPILEFETNAFKYLDGLDHIETTGRGERGRPVVTETLTQDRNVFRLPGADSTAPSR